MVRKPVGHALGNGLSLGSAGLGSSARGAIGLIKLLVFASRPLALETSMRAAASCGPGRGGAAVGWGATFDDVGVAAS